ncbi:hypothetical protein ER308_07750 [Egibacter rhizosphaerae]|uniref:Uncharacterized protein n=1 Tax=Egibacter rhizosphaerae TaxID=1670831 RepID=A0A411YE42_9ACTN|nr:hypothetical protein [Egibacter rhizosphaerae]QBI19456.1 hypothetical protein ER308_07750 [Egibacter rhizosphaerae]
MSRPREPDATPDTAGGMLMQPQPIVLSRALERSIVFWRALGYEVDEGTRTSTFAAMVREGHVVGLHTADELPPADDPSRF